MLWCDDYALSCILKILFDEVVGKNWWKLLQKDQRYECGCILSTFTEISGICLSAVLSGELIAVRNVPQGKEGLSHTDNGHEYTSWKQEIVFASLLFCQLCNSLNLLFPCKFPIIIGTKNQTCSDWFLQPWKNYSVEGSKLIWQSWMHSRELKLPVGSVLGLLSCLMQRHGFDPPLRRFVWQRGFFPLNWLGFWLPFRQSSFGWEYKPRSSLCTHAFHRMDSKDPDVHVLDGWMPVQKHTQHALSTKTESDYLNGWIKKQSHTQKI